MKKFLKTGLSSRRLWKPPSFDDFTQESPNKKRKLEEKNVETENLLLEPQSIEEVEVHPKKVEEVEKWLIQASNMNSASIALLSGPTGCGKTTVIKLLAKSKHLNVREWIIPLDKTNFKIEALFDTEVYDRHKYRDANQLEKFKEFLFRTCKYQNLFSVEKKSIVLVKDIPNLFYINPSILHSSLLEFKTKCTSPLVFICNEDTFLNDLFPFQLITKLNITHIKFNCLSKTLMHKVVSSRLKHLTKCVSKTDIDSICMNSFGDIRNAMSNIQLMTANNNVITNRDESHDFYRLIGRVLYPKYVSNDKSKFVHDVNELCDRLLMFDNCGLLLHENYFDTFTNLNNLTQACDMLSVSDMFTMYDDSKALRNYKNHVQVLGLMLSNKEPKRGKFKPLKSSTFSKVNKNLTQKILNNYMNYNNLHVSNKALNVDLIPYMKYISCNKLLYDDLNRFEIFNKYVQQEHKSTKNCVDEDEKFVIEDDSE